MRAKVNDVGNRVVHENIIWSLHIWGSDGMSTYADVAVAVLADAGVEFIFGVPGSLGSVELIEAASRRGIRYALCSGGWKGLSSNLGCTIR